MSQNILMCYNSTHCPRNIVHVAVISGSSILLALLGFLGNLAIIVTVAGSAKMRRGMHHTFILSLAVSDLLVVGFSYPMAVKRLIVGRVDAQSTMCALGGMMMVGCVASSLFNRSAFAFNRFLYVVHPALYSKLCGRTGTIIQIVLMWTLSFTKALLPFLGLGRYKYDPRVFTCLIDWESHMVNFILSILVFPVAINIINIVCYSAIFFKVYQSKKNISQHSTVEPADSSDHQHHHPVLLKSEDFYLILHLFLLFLVYNICFLPYMVLMGVEVTQRRRAHFCAVLLAAIMVLLNSFLNPLIYIVFNKAFHREAQSLRRKLCRSRRGNSVVSPINLNYLADIPEHSAI